MKTRNLLSTVAILVVALALVACAQTDSGVTTKVKAKLAAANDVPASKIEVSTHNGVVTLTGNVDSAETKERALQLARETKGVTDVVDMISVQTAEGTGNAPEPDRSMGDRIDVDTREGVVYLTGNVASENEKTQAIRVAKGTEGVREVQANLTIKS